MLDKLIVSKSSANENGKRNTLLLTTAVFTTTLLTAALIFSLFSQNLAMGQENLNISTLIAPPNMPETLPPKPQVAPEPKGERTKNPKTITRKYNIQRVDESPRKIPSRISTEKQKYKSRPTAPFVLTGKDSVNDTPATISAGPRCKGDCSGNTGIGAATTKSTDAKTKVVRRVKPIPKPPKIKKNAPPKKDVVKSLGVVNGVAKRLVMPKYPPAARAVRASGTVTVQVLIDKKGNVVSATALKGSPLLRGAALRAARSSKFSPTYLSNVPVKARGIIVYNFKL